MARAAAGRGQPDAARDLAQRALTVARDAGDRHGEAAALHRLAEVLDLAGVPERAVWYLRAASDIFADLESPEADEVRRRLDALASVVPEAVA